MKAYVVDSAAVRSNLQILKDAQAAQFSGRFKGVTATARPCPDGSDLPGSRRHALCRDGGFPRSARLRAGGFQDCDILMLRPTADAQELTQLLNLGAILTVSSQNDAAVLNGVAETLGVQAPGTRQDRYRHGPVRLFAGRVGSAAAHFQVYAQPARDRHLYASAFRVLQSESDDCAGRGVSGRSGQAGTPRAAAPAWRIC